MLALISESNRYFIDVIRFKTDCEYHEEREETPFGPVKYYYGLINAKAFIYFPNNGMSGKMDCVKSPLAIMHILHNKKISQLLLIAKAGGINPLLKVGDIVIPDDYIDITTQRVRSYYQTLDSAISIHTIMNDPFCPILKKLILTTSSKVRLKHPSVFNNVFDKGRYICTEGPAFESSAEISAYRQWGADIVGHTIVPYVYYARELGICFNACCIISNTCLGYSEISNNSPLLNNEETILALSDIFIEAVEASDQINSCNCASDNFILLKPTQRMEI